MCLTASWKKSQSFFYLFSFVCLFVLLALAVGTLEGQWHHAQGIMKGPEGPSMKLQQERSGWIWGTGSSPRENFGWFHTESVVADLCEYLPNRDIVLFYDYQSSLRKRRNFIWRVWSSTTPCAGKIKILCLHFYYFLYWSYWFKFYSE